MQQIVTTETHNGVKGLEYRTTLRTATGKGLSGLSTYGSTPEESRKEMAKHIQERDTLFSNILEESPEMTTAVDLHRESYEALQCILADKPDAMKAKELRELISVAQQLLAGLNAEDELTPREIAERRTKNKFSVIGGR